MNFTNEQKNALEATGRVLVSAAAGSGKTAVLVEKVINIISDKENPVDIDKLLVVTFTKAAADEMKSRISKRLSEKIKDNPNDFNLKKQKLLISSASIGTIDSICISLAKDYFYKLGIPCDFKTLNNNDSIIKQLSDSCLEEIFDKKIEQQDESFLRLLSAFGTEQSDSKLKENILKLYEYLCSLPFPDEYIERVKSLYQNFDNNSIFFDIIFNYAYELVKNSITVFKPAYNELLEEEQLLAGYGTAFAEINAKLFRALEFIENRNYNGIKNMLDNYTKAELGRVSKYPDVDFREKMKKARDKAESTFSVLSGIFNCSLNEIKDDIANLSPIVDCFLNLTKEFSERLYNLKLENNVFSFGDIEREVLKLLVTNENGKTVYTDEAKELSNKFFAVLVDEYQDTNDLQNTIFNALSDDGSKLFMVGDVKQSIYGFRKANPKNFLKFRNELEPYEKGLTRSKVVMSGNFRSAEGICDFVNFVFYRLLSERCGDMYYEQEDRLVPMSKFINTDKARVNLDIVSIDNPSLTPVQAQAYHIANTINDLVEKDEIITEDGSLRKAQFKDVCILLRAKSEISAFKTVFKEKNIPVWVDDNDGLLKEKEVVTLFSLLQVIDNPYNDVALISTITSDIYNFSADEVAEIRATDIYSDFYRVLLKIADENKKVKDFLDEIDEFRNIATVSSVSSLINKILSKTGYEHTVYLYENGELCLNNLLLFKQTAKDFEESGTRGLSAFIGYIKRQIKSNNTLQKSTIDSENNNCVKIMTMHRSKGLQFPIVFLACLNKEFNSDNKKADVLLTEKCGIGMKFFDSKRMIKYSTLPRNAALLEYEAIKYSEELRLLYVAMTRAKDFLFLVGADKNVDSTISSLVDEIKYDKTARFNPYYVLSCNNFLKMIMSVAVVHEDGFSLDEEIRNSKPNKKLAINIIKELESETVADTNNEILQFDERKYDDLATILDYKYPYKDLNKIFVKQSASALAHKEFSKDYDFTATPVFMSKQTLTSAQKGTAMHKFLQFCNFKNARENISDEIIKLSESGLLTKSEANSLNIDSLTSFLNSSLCEKLINSDKVYKEQGFMIEVPAKTVYDDLDESFENESIIIQGFCDLCFIDNDGLHIIDYKTDRVDKDELISRYKTQLDVYALALEKTFDCKVKTKSIYSFNLKELIKL